VPKPERSDIGHKLLTSFDAGDDDNDLINEIITLLDTPSLGPIFAPNALTEVDVTAHLPALQGARIHGAIDRLIIEDRRVLAVDYKSNRLVPNTAAAVPDGLLRQMGAYHAALLQIFPDHTVETAILWTHTATLMVLPTSLTVGSLQNVTAA